MEGGEKMASNHALEQIAELRNCGVEEARKFCLEVQALAPSAPSYKSIAQAMKRLGPSAAMEAVAEEAVSIHRKELAQRSHRPRRSHRRWQSPTPKSPTPKYIVVDGVVQSFSGWQKSEGIIQDE